ncbi:MAG: DUF3616 domain-containing protein [Halioglobus sp.]|nr:DUF3616 domain-containing protein [Halioglobus sp.]
MMIIRLLLTALLASSANLVSASVEEHRHSGICDASGVVAVGHDAFAVADDELNRLLIYTLHTSGPEESSLELSDFLKLSKKNDSTKNKPRKETKEADLEGAARVGDVVYWISSHGRNRKGKRVEARMQFFATKIHSDGPKPVLVPFGSPYTRLLQDIIAAPQHQRFELETAAALPPKAQGGLNIEAMADMPNGHLLIGFRSPTISGKSLIIELENPGGIIAGEAASFGRPRLIELDGGIRALASEGERYMVIGNEQDAEAGQSSLFLWDGESTEIEKIENLTFAGFNPEAIAALPDKKGGRILLLSDDGMKDVDGSACKKIRDPRQRHFRSFLYRHPELLFFD